MTTDQQEMISKTTTRNGSIYCAECGEFLGMTCDPFGRSECSSGCFETEDDDDLEDTRKEAADV